MTGDDEAPDIAAGWDTLADAYQRWVGWPDDALTWGLRCPPEHELRLVTDVVEGAITLVLGCGGGQDLVALDRLGAGQLVGVDPSRRQLEHAAERLGEADVRARLVEAGAEALSGIEAGSIDLVVSVQALNYVEDVDACVAELVRVLRPGGRFVMSVLHPADLSTDDVPPYGWHTPYGQVARDWVWDGLAETHVPFRSWFRSPAGWFTHLTEGGLVVERLLEPDAVEDRRWIDRGWLDEESYHKLDHVPGTILIRARRPG